MKHLTVLLLIFLILSCSQKDELLTCNRNFKTNNGGVVLTFDDDYIDDWYQLNSRLIKYNWKGTFFVTHFDKLPEREIRKLRYLQIFGNEVGAHGLNHLNTAIYIQNFGGNQFINQEISPMIKLMHKNGFNVKSFSYPYGARNTDSDNLLMQYFSILRGTTYGNVNSEKQHCYYTNQQLVYGLGIDESYDKIDLKYILSVLQYSKQNNKIAVLYAYKTVEKVSGKYEIDFNTLEQICKFINEQQMSFYTISELPKQKSFMILENL